MTVYTPFIEDLITIKSFYNKNEKPFGSLISKLQRNEWKKINQLNFCRPSLTELSSKDFSPLKLKKNHGHLVSEDEFVFTCSYRTSQDFWRYDDSKIRTVACQYPYAEEVIRLSVFAGLEPIRCLLLVVKLCFEKFWKKNHPLGSFDMVVTEFIKDFEQQPENLLHAGIFREQKQNENLSSLYDLFTGYYTGTNFYFQLSNILAKGSKILGSGITDLSVNTFIEQQAAISQNQNTAGDEEEQYVYIEIFESVFDLLHALSKHIIEADGPQYLTPLIKDIDKAKEKLKILYIKNISDKQKGQSSGHQLKSDIRKSQSDRYSSGIINGQMLRLINITEKYERLNRMLSEDPYSVLK